MEAADCQKMKNFGAPVLAGEFYIESFEPSIGKVDYTVPAAYTVDGLPHLPTGWVDMATIEPNDTIPAWADLGYVQDCWKRTDNRLSTAD